MQHISILLILCLIFSCNKKGVAPKHIKGKWKLDQTNAIDTNHFFDYTINDLVAISRDSSYSFYPYTPFEKDSNSYYELERCGTKKVLNHISEIYKLVESDTGAYYIHGIDSSKFCNAYYHLENGQTLPFYYLRIDDVTDGKEYILFMYNKTYPFEDIMGTSEDRIFLIPLLRVTKLAELKGQYRTFQLREEQLHLSFPIVETSTKDTLFKEIIFTRN